MKKNYVDWVRDAHAIEEQAEAILSRMVERLAHYPERQQRLSQRIAETKEYQMIIKSILNRLDTSHSIDG